MLHCQEAELQRRFLLGEPGSSLRTGMLGAGGAAWEHRGLRAGAGPAQVPPQGCGEQAPRTPQCSDTSGQCPPQPMLSVWEPPH